MVNETSDVLIIGGGPAGLTASIYSARLGMKTLLLESGLLGGRAAVAPEVWNFPGFPEGINGFELSERIVKQAKKFGATMNESEEVLNFDLNGTIKAITTRLGRYQCLAVIIATGTQRKKILVPGEDEFLGRGVSYCVVCDGPLFRDKVVAVIGSSNEALEDSLYLSNITRKVFLITQDAETEAEEALIDECQRKANIKILKAKIISILGENFVNSITIADIISSKETQFPVDGVFISIGSIPLTNLVEKAGIEVDERGCIKVDRRQSTNIEGVYAAGDCTCGGMQMITAAGEGAMASIQAHRYVKKIKK